MRTQLLFKTFGLFMMASTLNAQSTDVRPAMHDEAAVPKFELPSVLAGPDGKQITSKEAWPKHREYLLGIFARSEYGVLPTDPVNVAIELVDESPYRGSDKGEIAIRKQQYVVTLSRNGKSVKIDLLVVLPESPKADTPCFVGLNFQGNHTTTDDPDIRIPSTWFNNRDPGVTDNHATEASRGVQAKRWPFAEIAKQGFSVATAYYGDIDPDFDDGFENGVHALYPEFRCDESHPERWGTIGAWAWGMSRIVDAITKASPRGVDLNKFIAIGHSRLGKTALYAGASDERFKIVISNNSGCGGADLHKRCFGETVAIINRSFPHWFNRSFRKYNDNEAAMPFDQHMLIASIAPRPVYIASASKDWWADPKGELLAGHFASPAYELLGMKSLDLEALPEPNRSFGGDIGYHIREGEHDILELDWSLFMQFAKKHGL